MTRWLRVTSLYCFAENPSTHVSRLTTAYSSSSSLGNSSRHLGHCTHVHILTHTHDQKKIFIKRA